MNEELLYLNGDFMPLSEGRVSVEDRGFQLGDGVYEVVKVMNGRLIWLEDHLERLRRSLREIHLEEALQGQDLAGVLPELVKRAGLRDGFVYAQVTRGKAPRDFCFPEKYMPTVLAYARAKEFPDVEMIRQGIALHPVEDLRWGRCDIKSTNLLAAVLAKQKARQAGASEALFIGPGDVVREGGSSNVFAVLEGTLRTHPLDRHILGGITRKHVLRLAQVLGIKVKEEAFTLGEIYKAASDGAEIFTASTTMDLLPVTRVGEVVIGGGRPGPLTLRLLDALRAEQARLAGIAEPPPLLLQVGMDS